MKQLLKNPSTLGDTAGTREDWLEPIQLIAELNSFNGSEDTFGAINEQMMPQLNWSSSAISNSSYVADHFDYLDPTNQSAEGDDQLQKNYSSPYLMTWPQQSAWIVVFTLMLIVATVGNALVAWIVLGTLISLRWLLIYIYHPY